MESLPYSHIEKGTLLIATPEIDQGNFNRSVILVCEHNPTGSFGLVINKAIDIELPEEIISIKNLDNPSVSIRQGGPVQTNQMMLLHTSEEIPNQTLELCSGVYLGGDLDFLQNSITATTGPEIRLCFGYSGWGAGQLEREYLDGSWYLHPASKEAVFTIPAERLWPTLPRRMGGKYATISMIPEDITLN